MASACSVNEHANSGVSHQSRRRVGLVLGGNYRALGLVRSLGRRGIPVWVVKQDGHALAGLSRYAEKTLPWPGGDDEQNVAYLTRLAEQNAGEQFLLIPTDDECTTLISMNYEALATKFVLTTPAWPSLRLAVDKRHLYRLGENLGLDQPRTIFSCSREGLSSSDFQFPVILKPATREQLNPLTADKAWQVEDRPTLLSRFAEACNYMPAESIMVQELIPGGGEAQYSFAALCSEGRVQASLTAVRTRQFPIDFGRFSSFVQTVDAPELDIPARKLLEAIQFTGLVEIEFKKDARDGRYKLLDVNPRVWGWHSLCAAAGVDFPYLLWSLMWNEALPEVRARSGLRWVRFGSDFLVAIPEILKGRLRITEYLRGMRPPLETSMFAVDDPVPVLCHFPALFYLLCKRALKRVVPGRTARIRNTPVRKKVDGNQKTAA